MCYKAGFIYSYGDEMGILVTKWGVAVNNIGKIDTLKSHILISRSVWQKPIADLESATQSESIKKKYPFFWCNESKMLPLPIYDIQFKECDTKASIHYGEQRHASYTNLTNILFTITASSLLSVFQDDIEVHAIISSYCADKPWDMVLS